MVGLHTPGDYTITYGYGKVVKYTNEKYPEITSEDREIYLDMTIEQATEKLIHDMEDYAKTVSQRLYNREVAVTQEQFDALVLDEYQSGNCGSIIMQALEAENLQECLNVFNRDTIYPGIEKRIEAEAKLFYFGDYSEKFKY